MKLDPPTPIPSFPALARRCRDAGAAVPQVAMAQYTLNVREADIRAFVADAAEVTGRTFIVDARAGKVSVVSERPLSRSNTSRCSCPPARQRAGGGADRQRRVPRAAGRRRGQPAHAHRQQGRRAAR
jgi:hypothetical protein